MTKDYDTIPPEEWNEQELAAARAALNELHNYEGVLALPDRIEGQLGALQKAERLFDAVRRSHPNTYRMHSQAAQVVRGLQAAQKTLERVDEIKRHLHELNITCS